MGESVRILRELQELTQSQLSACGRAFRRPRFPRSRTIGSISAWNVRRCSHARSKCHPAVLVFPGWDVAAGSAA